MIYCGNAIDILKTFKAESVDCCVSDIPYKIATGGCSKKSENIIMGEY